MSQRETAELAFECPPDFELLELSDLSKTVSNIYAKMELLVEGESPFETYRKRAVPKPKEPLVVSKVHYGSDLTFILQAGSTILDAVQIITSLWAFKEMAKEIGREWRKHQVEKAFRQALTKSDKELIVAAEQVAQKYRMTLERLLQYIDPELEMIFESRVQIKRRKGAR